MPDIENMGGMDIPTENQQQPRLVEGDKFAATAGPPLDDTIRKIMEEAASPVLYPTEPAADPVAAAHGVKKFRVRFADPEVLDALDKAAAANGSWFVTVHVMDGGTLRSFFKPGERFQPTLPFRGKDGIERPLLAMCVRDFATDAAKRLAAIQEQAQAGIAGLADFGGGKTMDDERD